MGVRVPGVSVVLEKILLEEESRLEGVRSGEMWGDTCGNPDMREL
jgi:hypothetical protein